MILGFSPYTLAGDSHRAKSKPVDGQLSSNKEFARLCCRLAAATLLALNLCRFLLRSHKLSSKTLYVRNTTQFRFRCRAHSERFSQGGNFCLGPNRAASGR